MQEIIFKIRHFERGLLLNSVPFKGQIYQKQKGSGTKDQSLFRLRNKFREIPLLALYYLTKFDDVI